MLFRSAKVGVISQELSARLIAHGVSPDRVEVVGMPLEEVACGRREADALRADWGYRREEVVVTFFTEQVQCIYGMTYLVAMLGEIKTIFDNLGDAVRVVVKLHPLEPLEVEDLYRQIFTGAKYTIKRDAPLSQLISISTVCIAHFSRVLISAALLGKPIVCLNLRHDPSKSFLTSAEARAIAVVSYDDLKQRLNAILKPGSDLVSLQQAIESVKSRFRGEDFVQKCVAMISRLTGKILGA